MELFTRDISFKTLKGEEGRLDIEGTLRDVRQGEPLRHIIIRAEVDLVDGRIHRLEGEMPRITYEECPEALKVLDKLVGECIAPGFSALVRELVASPEGCTHLSVLVTNMGHVSVQGRASMVTTLFEDVGDAREVIRQQAEALGLPGSCYTWREGGPMMKRWREEFTGED